MSLEKMPKEELELLSYTKIAQLYLEEKKQTITTIELFKEILKLLGKNDFDNQDEIADFFQTLTTSKDFILLNDGKWDLKANHKIKIKIDEIYEEKDDEDVEYLADDTEEAKDESDDFDISTDDDYEDDDLSDLTILDEEELESENN